MICPAATMLPLASTVTALSWLVQPLRADRSALNTRAPAGVNSAITGSCPPLPQVGEEGLIQPAATTLPAAVPVGTVVTARASPVKALTTPPAKRVSTAPDDVNRPTWNSGVEGRDPPDTTVAARHRQIPGVGPGADIGGARGALPGRRRDRPGRPEGGVERSRLGLGGGQVRGDHNDCQGN